jgi:hypothetical protein
MRTVSSLVSVCGAHAAYCAAANPPNASICKSEHPLLMRMFIADFIKE